MNPIDWYTIGGWLIVAGLTGILLLVLAIGDRDGGTY